MRESGEGVPNVGVGRDVHRRDGTWLQETLRCGAGGSNVWLEGTNASGWLKGVRLSACDKDEGGLMAMIGVG